MNEKELQQAYTRHCETTGQTKMTRTGFEDFKAGFRLAQPAADEPEQKTAINTDDLPTKKYPLDAFHFDSPAAAPVAAGEPVAEFFVEFATLRRAMSIYGLSAPESNHELGSQMERYAIRVIEAVAKLPFSYPPAAAHGDEAVLPERKPDPEGHWVEMGDAYNDGWNACLDKIAAMRAQGHGHD